MVIVIINFFLYFSAFLIHWRRYKVIDNGFVLLATYAFIALACIANYKLDPSEWRDLSIFPLLYLFIVNMLFFRPFFFNNNVLINKINIPKSPLYFVFIYTYIFMAGVAIYYGYDSAIETIIKNDWNNVRNDVYMGNNVQYKNQLERFAKIFVSFLQPMSILFFYYLLSEAFEKKKVFTAILLLFSIILPNMITIVTIASRGMVVILVMQFLVVFLLFKNNINKKIKRALNISSLLFIGIFLAYTLSVTKSRFGETSSGNMSDDANTSLIFYFGHSMLTFADGVADTIRSFLWGDYLFGNQEILKIGLDNMLGTHFGFNFYTYVGSLYLDFGPFFTFVIALLFPFLMNLIFRYKSKLDMADIMIYVYYLTFLINGVFVIGIGYYIGWVMIFIIYILFKIIKLIK